MSVIDILFRVDDLCKKYEKYNIEKQRDLNAHGDDAFARFFSAVESEIDRALRKSEAASMETNRAAAVAMNAEDRRTKARLLEEVPKLQKLARKKLLEDAYPLSSEQSETELVFNEVEWI